MNTAVPRSRKERALDLMRANRLEEAKALCEEAAHAENNAGAWCLLGVIHGMLNNLAEAEQCLRTAVRLRPDYAEAHYNLGIALATDRRLDDAIAALRETVRLMPEHAEAHMRLGATLAASGRPEAAAESFHRAIRLKPDLPAAYVYLGNVCAGLGKMEEAVDYYRQALKQQPSDLETINNLGNALSELDRLPEAVDCYRRAQQLQPGHFPTLQNLSIAYLDARQPEKAEACARQALALKPDHAEAQFNLGNALRAQGKFEDAIASYREAIAIDGHHADAHFNLALTCLALGRFEQGWDEYPWQWRREGAAPRLFVPSPWDGSDLGGQDVFLHAEQGLGDELFFLRFVPMLRRRGAGRIVCLANPKIAMLLRRVPFIDHAAAPEEKPQTESLVLSVGDLPRLLEMKRTEEIPPPLGFPPLPEQMAEMQARLRVLGPPPYLGVTWRGGTWKKRNSLYKECPLAPLAQALKGSHATVLILQRLPRDGEIQTFRQLLGRPAHDFTSLNDNLESMLALLSLIDEYVGVSNTNMHLRAGAGKTARVLVPAPPEWRWVAEGKESPWFPGFTVYRQGYDGSWGTAFAELAVDLKKSLS